MDIHTNAEPGIESPLTSDTESFPAAVLKNISPIAEEVGSDNSGEEGFCQDISHKINIESPDTLEQDINSTNTVKQTLQHCGHFMIDKSFVENLVSSNKFSSKYGDYHDNKNTSSLLQQNRFNNYQYESNPDTLNTGNRFSNTNSSTTGKTIAKTNVPVLKSESQIGLRKNFKKVQFVSRETQVRPKSRKDIGNVIEPNDMIYQYSDMFDNSATSSHSEIMFQRFDDIQNLIGNDHNAGRIDEESSELSTNIFITKLNTQKQKNKDLEEELALNEASLAKITKELEIVQCRLARRENKIKEVSYELGNLQTEFKTSQKKIIDSKDYYKNNFLQCKRIIEKFNLENSNLESEVNELRDKCQNYGVLQVQAEEMKIQLKNSLKQNDDIIEENKHIVEELKSYNEKLTYYEETCVPELKQQLSNEKDLLFQLRRDLDKSESEKSSMESEMMFLQIRLDLVLKKIIEEDSDKKNAAEKQMESFAHEVTTIKANLHKQYQEKMEKLVIERMHQVQDQVKATEHELCANYNSKLNQKDAEHLKEMQTLRQGFHKDDEKLKENEKMLLLRIKNLTKENQILQDQRSVISNAISSYNPQTKFGIIMPEDREVQHKHIQQHKNIPRKFQDQPLITSTSLSNVEEYISDKELTDRKELKSYRHHKNKLTNQRSKRIYKYQEILNSQDSGTEYSRRDPLVHERLNSNLDSLYQEKFQLPEHDTHVERKKNVNYRR